jgi:hypothetical protein
MLSVLTVSSDERRDLLSPYHLLTALGFAQPYEKFRSMFQLLIFLQDRTGTGLGVVCEVRNRIDFSSYPVKAGRYLQKIYKVGLSTGQG